jgi:hypothetical protein
MATAPRLNPPEVAEIGSRLAENIARAVKAPDRVVRELTDFMDGTEPFEWSLESVRERMRRGPG